MRTTHVVSTISLAISVALGIVAAGAASASETREPTRVERSVGSSNPQPQEKLIALGGYKDVDRIKSEARERSRESKRSSKEDDRSTRDCSERRCRDGGGVQTLRSEAIGWYLADIYGRMKSAGI